MRLAKTLIALATVLITASFAFAQPTTTNGKIAGKIVEHTTGQPVGGATVSVKNVGTATSNADGEYVLEIKPGVYDVEIKADKFAPVLRNQIIVTGGRSIRLDVELDVTLSESVEVRSSLFAESVEQPVSNHTLDREALRQTPGSGGDPLRAINSLPSVSAASAEFADLVVRGGTTDENLVYVDRIPVDDFTYFTDKYDSGRGGRASILAPDVFDKAEFSAGGFGARYGDKMSSVLDVTVREANRERVQGVFFLDSGTAGGSLDVPFKKRGGWVASARRSYIDVALDIAGIADQGLIGYPRTWDFTNKVVYDINKRHKLSVTALNFFESFDQSDTQAGNIDRRTDRFRMNRSSQRNVFGGTLSSTLSDNVFAQTTAWFTNSHNDGTFYLPNTSVLQRSRDLKDSRFGVKEDMSVAATKKVELAFGGGVFFDSANYNTFENAGKPYSPLEEEYNAAARQNTMRLGHELSAYAYGQATFHAGERFTVTPGVRFDRNGVTGETTVSPRIGARFAASGRVSFTFAAGIYRQPPSFFVLSLTPANRNLQSQTADHVIGGVEWLATPNIRLRVETFYKRYSDLVIQPIRLTQTNPATGNYFNTGRGTASGVEISVQKSLSGFFAGEASYGYMRSRRSFDLNSALVPSDYERPHQLTLIGITQPFGFTVAAKFRYASGLPYTIRTPLHPPASSAWIQRISNLANVNAARLPVFASLDIRAERRFSFRRWSLSPYIDYFNITNHRTVVQTNYEFFRSTPQFLVENKRFPIFGLRVEI